MVVSKTTQSKSRMNCILGRKKQASAEDQAKGNPVSNTANADVFLYGLRIHMQDKQKDTESTKHLLKTGYKRL